MTATPRQSPMNDATAADLLGPKEVLEIQEQGRRAALAGRHVKTCPWGTETDENRARRDMWIRGYSAGRTLLRSRPNET